MNLTSLNPFNIVFMFDVAFEPPLFKALAQALKESSSVRFLISFKRVHILKKHGFKVSEPVAQMNTRMHGSNQNHMAYIYKLDASREDDDNRQGIKITNVTKISHN